MERERKERLIEEIIILLDRAQLRQVELAHRFIKKLCA